MKRMFFLAFILLQIFLAISHSKPMETFENYNVLLVHGAGGRYFGLDCDNDSELKEAWEYLSDQDRTSVERSHYQILTGGYGKKFGFTSSLPFVVKDRESSAEDMDVDNEGLRPWLTDKKYLAVIDPLSTFSAHSLIPQTPL
ncbi:MAG: hypothetical protein LBC85_07080 [Fibromonadaceae bacterium]|jgi:hypothetical protein|nr:hypothetical protein [Fibromonadaceae bacterium]